MGKKSRLIPVLIFLPLLLGALGSFAALVNRIISLHGGQVDVRSRQNGPRGTVFTLRLPEAKN